MKNETYHHPGQPEMQVEVILASKGIGQCPPIYTVRMRYPRPIHGEIMTHRVFGRNARSSRAVPVRTMLNEVIRIPYVPWHWLKNKPGMQGTDSLTPQEQDLAEDIWLESRDAAVEAVKKLFDPTGLNIHKQNPNRLLEPYSWIDTLITSTDWDNFLWLRQHHAAEPHLQDLAELVAKALDECSINHLEEDEWHMPYISPEDWDAIDEHHAKTEILSSRRRIQEDLLKLSAARCARISYKPFNGDSTIEAELNRYNLLVTDERVHASPLEHQARPDLFIGGAWSQAHLHGNLTGYIQHRKLIPNEVYRG